MKILFCNYEYPPLGGGGGVVMAALARELAKRHEVTVITSSGPDLPQRESDAGVDVLRVPVLFRRSLAVANLPSMMAYLPTSIWRAIGTYRRTRFDVINTHFVVPTGPVGQILHAFYGTPNVLSVHGGDLYDPSKKMSPHRHTWLRTPIRYLLKAADALVGQSQDTVRHVSDIYGIHRPVDLVPLGIERPVIPAHPSRRAFGIPDNAFVMATVGRLVARKDSVQLVRMLARSAITNAYLLMVGDGPDASAVRKTASELGVSDRVRLLGFVSDAEKYQALAASDVFVSSSQHEGFGLVFLEAMAFGLPVVCYDKGGQTDFLSTGVTGAVVKLNDFEAFTAAIVGLHANRELRARIGAENRSRVESYFIDRCAERYEAIFKSVIARQPVPLGTAARKLTS